MHRWADQGGTISDRRFLSIEWVRFCAFSSLADWFSIFRARIDGSQFRRPSEADVAQLSVGLRVRVFLQGSL
ncbi:hypothetical protein CY34DRAFT_798785 [Suillus luteus UH-Slu-Lm8-n1]|uniref:Uncharacterized protein n=1 Tax=Suillus luteus UH-Slu-Lm8-n1 TaxID=930992 RepID=A0A0D0BQG9_9AGAM|nr:hypothetical protein CY34DRAFT_798785 [Suillus luteus UH-Slu-Lm8-n1]